jgi:hypothetical protein
MVWLALREKVVSNWIGIVSILPVLATLGMAMVLAIAGFPGWSVRAGSSSPLPVSRSPASRRHRTAEVRARHRRTR